MGALCLKLSICLLLTWATSFARCAPRSDSISPAEEHFISHNDYEGGKHSPRHNMGVQRQVLATKTSPEWRGFKRRYAKVYSSEREEERRIVNYLETKKLIKRHNSSRNRSYTLGLNDLADLSSTEMRQMAGFLGACSEESLGSRTEGSKFVSEILKRDPDKALDWRDYGNIMVPPVRQQGKCRACWSMTVADLLESQQYRLSMANTSLSIQELLDCERGRSQGCDGGYLDAALDYVRWNGLQTDGSYPYEEAQNQYCKANPSQSMMRGGVPIAIATVGEDNFRKFLTWYGPFIVSMNASHADFKSWKSGVYNGCNPRSAADHVVLLVGYGTDPVMGPYWVIKNSWGTDWGEKGFAKIKRGVNMCRIADYAYIYKLNWALYFPGDNVKHYGASAGNSSNHRNVLRHIKSIRDSFTNL